MERYPDWPARLAAYIDSVKASPFAWGSGDCAVFAAGAVEAQIPIDLSSVRNGKYSTAKGALKALKKLGAGDLAAGVGLFLKLHEHPSQAQVGDIALVPSDGEFGFGLGVFNGETILLMTLTGMGVAHRDAATKAFKVG